MPRFALLVAALVSGLAAVCLGFLPGQDGASALTVTRPVAAAANVSSPVVTTTVSSSTGAPPVAVDDSVSVVNQNPVRALLDVVANDTIGAASETISVITGPRHGQAVIVLTTHSGSAGPPASQSAGTAGSDRVRIHSVPEPGTADPDRPRIGYLPDAGFTGADELTYRLTTIHGSSTATVRITVTGTKPIAHNVLDTTTQGRAVQIPITNNDSAFGGATLTLGRPKHGTATVLGTDLSLSTEVTYDPAADFIGTDTFTYTLSDTFGTATATVKVLVDATATTPTPSPSTEPLGDTGTPAEQLFELGGLLLIVGTATTLIARKRKHGQHTA